MTWIFEDFNIILRSAISAFVILCVLMIVVRINGLRSFAKITPIDFAVTISIGSVINSTAISDSNSLLKGVIIILILLGMQTIFGRLKSKFRWFDEYLFNQPLYLMKDGEFLEKNIDSTHISRDNIVAKLRENNITHLKDVKAVVLETTGDISVLSGDSVDDYILSDVRITPSHDNVTLNNKQS